MSIYSKGTEVILMKKVLSLLLALTFIAALSGCNNRNMDYITEHEPNITGIVYDVGNSCCMIDSDGSKYQISLKAENPDSYTDVRIGDEITVYYDGTVAESYPMQINTVYAITLKTPA